MGSTRNARSVVLIALALGVLGDLLVRPSPPGLGLALWSIAVAGAAIVGRRGVASLGGLYPVGPVALAALFGGLFAWRDSSVLQGLFGAAALIAWTVAFLDRPARAGVTSHATAATAAIASAVLASPLVLARARERDGKRVTASSGVRVAVAGALLAAPLLLVFGTLFAAADPLFARYAGNLARSLDDAIEHLGTMLLLAWLTGGLVAGLALARCPSNLEIGSPRPAIGNALGVALGLVVALFAAFLAVQARAILEGSAWIEARAGVSYAEYARHGFFQLLACAAIALPLVLVADWAVAPGDPRRRRMTALSLALVLAVLAVLASAARRMALYIGAYGLTELRLYASATMVWLAIGFVAFGVAAIRGTRDRFVSRALTAGTVILLSLGILDPAARIVAFNADRAPGSAAGFDARYATSLGTDAVPVLLDILPALPPASRCVVARDLLDRGRSGLDPDWRTFNLSRARARARLQAADAELRAWARGCDPPITSSSATRTGRRPPPWPG